MHYENYNRRFGKDGIHQTLDWSDLQEEVDKFRFGPLTRGKKLGNLGTYYNKFCMFIIGITENNFLFRK